MPTCDGPARRLAARRPRHGISTGDPLRSAPRPHNRPARSLGRPERPLQAPSKSGNRKKIEFPHPTSYMYELRGYVDEGRFFSYPTAWLAPFGQHPAPQVQCGGPRLLSPQRTRIEVALRLFLGRGEAQNRA